MEILLLIIAGTCLVAFGYAAGHRDGKREGWTYGRAVSRSIEMSERPQR